MEKNKKDLSRPMTITTKVVIVRDHREVLLLKRSNGEKFNGEKWDLPGGTLEAGETIRESLKREVQEETGLKIKIGPVLQISEFPKENKNFKDEKRGIRFLAYYQSGEVELNDDEHSEYQWLPIDEAIEKLSNEDGFEMEKRETLLKAREYLEMREGEERWKRAMADMENYKKRAAKEKEEFRKYCLENFILELLSVIDNFQIAIEHTPEKDKKNDWMIGILHIKNQLENVLRNEGVEKIKVALGDKIDENIHQVISGEGEKGEVKKVLKEGYKIGERVIRPASVISC